MPADFIQLLTVAIDSRLAPLYRHVLHRQTQDSHEIFTLTGPVISQLDKYFAYMLSVHDDGGERGPHLPDVFAAFSPDLKAQVVEKVKSFRVDATFVTGFKKGDWIKAGNRESIIVRLFDLFGSWLVHFNKIRPTAANSVYDVLVHAHFDNFRLFAGRAFNAIAYPRMCLPPTSGIEHVLSVASANASLGSQVMSMQQSLSDFVNDLLENASEEFKRFLVATSLLTVFPSLFVSGHNAFELFQTAQTRAMELVELANTNPQLRAVLLAGGGSNNTVQVVAPPRPPTPPTITVDGGAPRVAVTTTDDNKRKIAPAAPGGSPSKKGDKQSPASPARRLHGLDAGQAGTRLLQPRPQDRGWQRDSGLGDDNSDQLHQKMAWHIGCAPTPEARCWGCVMSTHSTLAYVLSLCENPLGRNHVGPNAPMHQKPVTFNSAMTRGDFR